MIKDFILNTVIPWLIAWINENPNIAPIIVILITIQGFFRLWLKPIMSGIIQFTNWTPTPKDNEFVKKILESKAYKIFTYLIDWFISIKLPGVNYETTSNNPSKLASDINNISSKG